MGRALHQYPEELGPYVYTTLNVMSSSIKDAPHTVRRFVKGVLRGLKYTYQNREKAALITQKEFPTTLREDLKGTLDRSFADEVWRLDGMCRNSRGIRPAK